MTEAEWLTCGDPRPMLRFLDLSRTDRRLHAYLVACGQNLLPLLSLPASRRAVEVMGRYLNGRATDEERHDAEIGAESAVYKFGVPDCEAFLVATGHELERLPRADLERMAGWGPTPLPETGYRLLADVTHFASYLIAVDRIGPYPNCLFHHLRFLSAPLLREVFGNPFRPVTLDPSWLTSTVVALATGIYAHRAFDRMPILADALQDAGCDNADILDHCRGPGPHVRGCWVVDLVLGKS